MARIGILISGCGVFDGAEIHESVLTLLAVVKRGHTPVFLAPDVAQREVVDHHRGQPVASEARSVRTEAARIARGPVLTPDDAGNLDALILPGGFGAAKNLTDFAVKGADCTSEPTTAALIRHMVAARRPVGAWCIAPVVVAAALRGDPRVELTIGCDPDASAAIEKMGAKHVAKPVEGCVVDRQHKIVSTPAYMLDADVAAVAVGIDGAVQAVCDLL
jgi:enhancing lycopene biosynthesis protein 2